MSDQTLDTRREYKVVGLVTLAHLLSHVYMLVLPPLFPLLAKDLEVGYVELGLTITAFAITTGGLQTPMGFLVNRIGGKSVLIGGLLVNALAIGLCGFVTSYWQLIGLMLLAGVGSSVFHPADYAILSARVDNSRLGRALSVHTLGGNLGFLAAPLLILFLTALFGWRIALISVGGAGVALALFMMVFSSAIGDGGKTKHKSSDSWRTLITSRKIMLLFLFYAFASCANTGITHFSVAAYKDIYGLPLAATAIALTAYQALALLAVLPGGLLADKIKNHETILILFFSLSAVLVILSGLGLFPFWLVVGVIATAGALRGLVNASRDVTVRHAATAVSVGTLFGFVTTGYSAGQIVGPAIYGLVLDLGRPELVFWTSAAFSLLAVITLQVGRMAKSGK